MASRVSFLFVAFLALAGCSSAQKQRAAEREKLSVSSGMLCDFVNGDEYQDVEVQLNLEMAKKCDINKAFTMTGYKNASEVHGIVYCCALRKEEKGKMAKAHGNDDDLLDVPAAKPLPPAPKKEEKKPEPVKPAEPKKGAAIPPPSGSVSPAPASVGPATPANPPPAAAQPPAPAKPAGPTKSDMDAILDD